MAAITAIAFTACNMQDSNIASTETVEGIAVATESSSGVATSPVPTKSSTAGNTVSVSETVVGTKSVDHPQTSGLTSDDGFSEIDSESNNAAPSYDGGSYSGSSNSGINSDDSISAPSNRNISDDDIEFDPVYTSPKPSETTSKYSRMPCPDCGEKKLVFYTDYHYITPEKTHVETNPTWDYGIQHCEVQINWMHSSYYTDDEYYNGHYDERPTIVVPFDRMVDIDGVPFDNDAEREATNEALRQAHEWTASIGINEPRCSWQTNGCYSEPDKINYQENPYTVVDEPEHEYVCNVEICENCGCIIYVGNETQIR